jgi:hypothetical protein
MAAKTFPKASPMVVLMASGLHRRWMTAVSWRGTDRISNPGMVSLLALWLS